MRFFFSFFRGLVAYLGCDAGLRGAFTAFLTDGKCKCCRGKLQGVSIVNRAPPRNVPLLFFFSSSSSSSSSTSSTSSTESTRREESCKRPSADFYAFKYRDFLLLLLLLLLLLPLFDSIAVLSPSSASSFYG